MFSRFRPVRKEHFKDDLACVCGKHTLGIIFGAVKAISMVPAEGLEPPTFRFEADDSIQLSYAGERLGKVTGH